MEEIFEHLMEVISEINGFNEADIYLDSSFEELNLDENDIKELHESLEEKYDYSFTDDSKFLDIDNLEDLISYIERGI